jgi:hypothetical protein
MSKTFIVLIAAMIALLLGAKPSVAQVCCQFRGGCTQTTGEDCKNRQGALQLGICVVGPGSSRCRIVPRPPPRLTFCCQLPGGCTEVIPTDTCMGWGGVVSVATCHHVPYEPGKPSGFCGR